MEENDMESTESAYGEDRKESSYKVFLKEKNWLFMIVKILPPTLDVNNKIPACSQWV